MKRRLRVLKVTVTCRKCGGAKTVPVWPAQYELARKVVGNGPLFAVPCERHCGADVPVQAEDIRQAA